MVPWCKKMQETQYEYNLLPLHNFSVKIKNISDCHWEAYAHERWTDCCASLALRLLTLRAELMRKQNQGCCCWMWMLLRLHYNSTISPCPQWETKFVLPRKPRPNCRQWLSIGSHFVSLTALPLQIEEIHPQESLMAIASLSSVYIWHTGSFPPLKTANCKHASKFLYD